MGSLEGKNILVTSGPMRGYIDAVRYISNTSTGRLGAAVAAEALSRGASVTFVYGMGSKTPDVSSSGAEQAGKLSLVEIETMEDLMAAIREKLKGVCFDAIIHAMAVLDYAPEKRHEGKIASGMDSLQVTFVKTPKVIKHIRTLWPNAFLVSFKLETGLRQDELVERAYASLQGNGADLVVANNLDEIVGDSHHACLINKQKRIEARCDTRQDIANRLMDIIARNGI